MSYRYIFWDFNGTIIDDVDTALGCVNDLLSRKGKKPITLSEYYEYVDTPIVKFYYRILPPEEIDFEEISKYFHADYAKRENETHLKKGIFELMHKLKNMGFHQYIITANNIEETTHYINKFGLADCIDALVAPDNSLVLSKIDRAKAFFDSLNIDRNQAIFIGDTLHDIDVANALGIDCITVSYGHQGRKLLEMHNAYVVDSAEEIEEYILDERVADFHTHSTASDGSLTPTEVVFHAKQAGLSVFALTDHDSVDGIQEATDAAGKADIEFIPGIEFSTADDTETHIIGLFIDPENTVLLNTINKLKSCRKRRMEDIISKLRALGFDVTHEEALSIAGGNFLGRAHIAKLMVNKGYCKNTAECFDKYIGLNKPAYSKKNELTAIEAIHAIKASGGLAFLAHLHQTNYDINKLRALLTELKQAGLDGIEGYYTQYTPEQISEYRALGAELNLALSGGSDFHGTMKQNVEIAKGYGNLKIPYYIYENLKNIKERNV